MSPSGPLHTGETATHRHWLIHLIRGNGLDVGHGGDPIVSRAVTVDLSEEQRAHCGSHPTNLSGDARNLYWFRDGVLDYVYSSHCLEDFFETETVLREWMRVLKRPGGLLILLLPDQARYLARCAAEKTEPNRAHQHANFSLAYVNSIVDRIGGCKEILRHDPVDDCNFAVVYEMV